MDQINVKIQIEAIPWVKQSQASLKIEIEAETTIIELIDYLIEQQKILVSSSEIVTVVDGNVVSNHANISDFYKKSKGGLCLRFQSKQSAVGALPTQTPKPKNNTQSQLLPGVNNKKPDNTPPSVYTDNTSNYPTYPTYHDNSSISNSNKSSSQQYNNLSSKSLLLTQNQTSIKQSDKKQTPKPIANNPTKYLNQSIQKSQDIEFSIKYKQGNYQRQFSYSSKKAGETADQMQINNSPNNPISIIIIDNGRKIKFEVDKI